MGFLQRLYQSKSRAFGVRLAEKVNPDGRREQSIDLGLGLGEEKVEELQRAANSLDERFSSLESRVSRLEKEGYQSPISPEAGPSEEQSSRSRKETIVLGTVVISYLALAGVLFHRAHSIAQYWRVDYSHLTEKGWDGTSAAVAYVVGNGVRGGGLGLLSGGVLGGVGYAGLNYLKKIKVSPDKVTTAVLTCSIAGAAGGVLGAEVFGALGTVIGAYAGTALSLLSLNKELE